ncbi:MAG TPA: hypothetical protein VH684_13530 [Xanthobacteraceae bacterium]|jgi:hypothetical protein
MSIALHPASGDVEMACHENPRKSLPYFRVRALALHRIRDTLDRPYSAALE